MSEETLRKDEVDPDLLAGTDDEPEVDADEKVEDFPWPAEMPVAELEAKHGKLIGYKVKRANDLVLAFKRPVMRDTNALKQRLFSNAAAERAIAYSQLALSTLVYPTSDKAKLELKFIPMAWDHLGKKLAIVAGDAEEIITKK